jgi:hypothetical protein
MKKPKKTIELTTREVQRILLWRTLMPAAAEKEHWGKADSALIDKLLDFVGN